MQNRKLIIYAVAQFFFSICANAQETKPDDKDEHSDKKFFYEQGLNATQFAKQYLSFNTISAASLPYLFTGNLVFKHIGFRYGVNVTNATSSSSSSPTGSNSAFNTDNTDKSKSNTYNARGGFFYYKRLSKRFVANMGADFLYIIDKFEQKQHSSGSNSVNNTFTSDVSTKTSTNSMGFGPFFSIQYFIAPRVSLGTESSIYYTMSTQKQSGTNTTVQSFFDGINQIQTVTIADTKTSAKSTGTNIIVPLSLFVYFRF